MRKKQWLASLNNVYTRIGVSKTHGVGVIAIRPIPKGTDPFIGCDEFGDLLRIPKAELDAYPAPTAAKELVRAFFVLEDGYYHVPDYGLNGIPKSYYLNHSTTPNTVAIDGGETFTTARAIKTGEELTADYRTYNREAACLRPAKKG